MAKQIFINAFVLFFTAAVLLTGCGQPTPISAQGSLPYAPPVQPGPMPMPGPRPGPGPGPGPMMAPGPRAFPPPQGPPPPQMYPQQYPQQPPPGYYGGGDDCGCEEG